MPDYDFTIAVDGLDAELAVLRFDGVEGMSRPFRFDVELTCRDPDIAFEDVVGKSAELQWITSDEPRIVNGIVSRFEFSGQGPRLAYYSLRLVPRVWSFSLRRQSRIFHEKSTPDILAAVLKKGGLAQGEDYKFDFQRSYKPRHFCVQYRETDFDFLSRVMEEEGIFYFFRHEEGKHVMVIADSASATEPMSGEATVLFRGGESEVAAGESVRRFTFRRAMRTGAVAMQEFDFKKPKLDLLVSKAAGAEDELEDYEYPGSYPDPDHGKAYAKIRLEQFRARRDVGAGRSDCRRLIPGFRWNLEEHPRSDFNAEYTLTWLSHRGEQPQAAEEDNESGEPLGDVSYVNKFECIPSAVTFRPEIETPAPTVDGVQTAVVTGPPGEEIHTDEFGRVKIKFHWDREGAFDDKSSYWVRVAQAQSYGSMLIPRVGWEVVVDFQEGDPERPIIIGRLHNGTDPGPYGLPGSKTRTAIVSQSSPGGGNANEIRFEDSAGSEEFYVHASKDWNILVDNDKGESVLNDETLSVKRHRTKTVGGDQSEEISGNKSIEVKKNHSEEIKGDMSLTVGGGLTEKIGKDHSTTVGGDRSESISGDYTQKISKGGKIKVSRALKVSVTGLHTLSVGGKHTEKVKGLSSEDVVGNKSISTKGAFNLTADKDATLTVKGKVTIEGKDGITLKAGKSKVTLGKDGKISIEGSDIQVKGSGKVILKGSNIAGN